MWRKVSVLLLTFLLLVIQTVPPAYADQYYSHNLWIAHGPELRTVYSDFWVYEPNCDNYYYVRLRLWVKNVTATSMYVTQVGVRVTTRQREVYQGPLGIYAGNTRWYADNNIVIGARIPPYTSVAKNYTVNRTFTFLRGGGLVFWKYTHAGTTGICTVLTKVALRPA